jgi:hypothetical protein
MRMVAPLMRWVRVYDPDRKPAHWSEIIRSGQYAVFLFDARTHVLRNADGKYPARGEASVAICADLQEAVGLSNSLVAAHPDLCCEIYNHEGMSGDPLQVIYNPAVRGRYVGRPVARRETLWGIALCLCSVGFIVADFRHDLAFIWGYVIGLKLLIVGCVLVVRGVLGLYEHRR